MVIFLASGKLEVEEAGSVVDELLDELDELRDELDVSEVFFDFSGGSEFEVDSLVTAPSLTAPEFCSSCPELLWLWLCWVVVELLFSPGVATEFVIATGNRRRVPDMMAAPSTASRARPDRGSFDSIFIRALLARPGSFPVPTGSQCIDRQCHDSRVEARGVRAVRADGGYRGAN